MIEEYSNYFGSLEDIDVRYLDFVLAIVNPNMNVREYLSLHFKLYHEISCLVTGGLTS